MARAILDGIPWAGLGGVRKITPFGARVQGKPGPAE